MAKPTGNPLGRPPKYETAEEMQRIIDLYFLACKENRLESLGIERAAKETLTDEEISFISNIDEPNPLISGLAYVLGMTTQALRDYEKKDDFLCTVKEAKQRVEMNLESRLAFQACTGSIFSLKNNFGWKDKTETEQYGKDGAPLVPSVIKIVHE